MGVGSGSSIDNGGIGNRVAGTAVDLEPGCKSVPESLWVQYWVLRGQCAGVGSASSNQTGDPCGSVAPEGTPEGDKITLKICSMLSLKALILCMVWGTWGASGPTELCVL